MLIGKWRPAATQFSEIVHEIMVLRTVFGNLLNNFGFLVWKCEIAVVSQFIIVYL